MTLAAGDDVRLVQCTAVCNFSTLVGMSAHEVNALLDTGCSLVVTPVVPQAADDAIIEAVHSFANEYRTKGVVTVVSSDSDMVVALSLATLAYFFAKCSPGRIVWWEALVLFVMYWG